MKVGPCISACAGIVRPERLEHLFARDRCGQRQRAAGQRLGQRDDVRNDARVLEGEHRAGAAEAGKDLVEDQQQLVAVGGGAQRAQHFRVVKAHAAGALHQRLDDDGGKLVGVPFERCLEGGSALLVDRQIDRDLLRQQAAERRVHAALRIGYRHGAGGVAVIAAGEGEKTGAAAAPRLRQYCTAIFSATSTATEPDSLKNTRSRSPGPSSPTSRRAKRQRRFVHQAAEHDVGHLPPAGARPRRGCADGYSRGRRSTTRRCRRSIRGRRPARCGCRGSR